MRTDDDFADFYVANYGRTVALVTVLLGDRHEAEDVAQEAFARAILRWSRLRKYDSPEAWVRRVALRLSIDSHRRVTRAARVLAQAAPAAQHDSQAAQVSASEVGDALLALPLPQRQVVFLHYHLDLPVTQIATDLGLPVSTVKARLASGRRRLEQELSQQPEVARDEG